MVEIVGAEPRGQPDIVRLRALARVHLLAPQAVSGKERLIPDFDVVAFFRQVEEALDGGGVAATDPILHLPPCVRALWLPRIAQEGLGGEADGFSDLPVAGERVIEDFEQGAVVVQIRGDGEPVFAACHDADLQGDCGAIAADFFHQGGLFGRNALDGFAGRRKVADGFEGHLRGDEVWHGEGGESRCGFGRAMRSVVVSCGIRIHGLTLSGGGVGVGQPSRRLTYETYEKEVYEIYE